jgi:hypothetical protein
MRVVFRVDYAAKLIAWIVSHGNIDRKILAGFRKDGKTETGGV